MPYEFTMDGVLLPVTPSTLKIKVKNQNSTMTLINEGEINLLKSPGLTEIQFEALFPRTRYPFVSGELKEPSYYMGFLARLKAERRHFPFVVARHQPDGTILDDTNLDVSLEDYEVSEDAKKYGLDIAVTIKLKQYRPYGTKMVVLEREPDGSQTATVSAPRDASTAPAPRTYTVQKGDCLWNIAKKCLGDGERWSEVAKLNADKIVNPNKIYPGQVLTLPT
ncbi:LysM peptidoglycan-binding domain-containing protein [Pseudoflavonifractor phocaeensis]|uniref:LysM peptidoglycan-binding domain-containing protein n=1 Tax=Pseudoflavonifractor phocaeensis TaxID=1870988 RepID=UPI00313A9DCA